MTRSRLAALVGVILLGAGSLLAFAQEFASAPSAMGGNGRARVYSQGEVIGFALIAVSLALFVAAWRMSGRQHGTRW